MPELSTDDKIEFELVIKGATAFLELEREAGRETLDANRHEDRLTAWIVGLSAGAIAAINAIPKFAGISRWQALLVFSFFILSIVSGLVYRWILKELETADRFASYNKRSSLIAVIVLSTEIRSSEDIKKAKTRLKEIMEKKDPQYIELIKKVNGWAKRAKIMEYVAPVMFVLGVFALTAMASIHWGTSKGTSQVPGNQAIPQIQETKP